jgi:TolB-like protein
MGLYFEFKDLLTADPAGPSTNSLAVLPFTNLSGDDNAPASESSMDDLATKCLKKGSMIYFKEKTEDGKWKPFRDIANSDLPLPTAE